MRKNKQISIEYINENYIEQEFSDIISEKFVNYAYSVIEDRALPDARDGLKPSQRRILITMNDLGLTSESSTEKSAKIAGTCSAEYHPHGETIVYPTMVRMAQDWIMRYPLVHPQGNFGSIDSDSSFAAARYTEAKLTPFGEFMVKDLSPEVVEFVPNYNEKKYEPVVLPTLIPNLLLNGCMGIAVGMATKIPPHNLKELANVIEAFINNYDITIDEIMKIMPGPDFPTGGVLLGQEGVREYYTTGKGNLILEGVYEIKKNSKGNEQIIITQLPYGVAPTEIINQIMNCIKDKKIEGIIDLKDLSNRNKITKQIEINIVIDIQKNVDSQLIINQLLKYTSLRTNFMVNSTVMLNNKIIENANIKTLMKAFILHRKKVLINKHQHELNKLQNRNHILDGLINVTKYINEVVNLILNSENSIEAQKKLIENNYVNTEIQAKAILDISLKQLTKLEINTLTKEQEQINKRIQWIEKFLSNDKNILKYIAKELQDIANKYGDERKTQISHKSLEIPVAQTIKEEPTSIIYTIDGYIKRVNINTYKNYEVPGYIYNVNTTDDILFFDNTGIVYKRKCYEIPLTNKNSKGIHVANLLKLKNNEIILQIASVQNSTKPYIIILTEKGLIKKGNIQDYNTTLKNKGTTYIKLEENDKVIKIDLATDDDYIMSYTLYGKALAYKVSDISLVGKNAKGVINIKLTNDDKVISGLIINEFNELIAITTLGFANKINLNNYIAKRGTKGKSLFNNLIENKNGLIKTVNIVYNNMIYFIDENKNIVNYDISQLKFKNISIGTQLFDKNIINTLLCPFNCF